MQTTDILLSLANIAAAFIGFTGIVVVFARITGGDQGSLTGIARFRLQSMVASGLQCMTFALLPLVFLAADVPEPLTWQICGAVGVLALIATSYFYLRRYYSLRGEYGAQFVSSLIFASSLVANPALVLLLISNIMGWGFGPSFWPYLIVVIYTLFMTAAVFLLLIFRTAGPPSTES
jgi:hypothetical protein